MDTDSSGAHAAIKSLRDLRIAELPDDPQLERRALRAADLIKRSRQRRTPSLNIN